MRRHANAFAAGVVVAFLALAALLLGLRAPGEAIGWGFQLQSPAFVAACALLFVAIGLNFSGVYEVGAALTRLGEAPVPAPAIGGATGGGAAGTTHGRADARGAGAHDARVRRGAARHAGRHAVHGAVHGSAIGFTLGQPAAVLFAWWARSAWAWRRPTCAGALSRRCCAPAPAGPLDGVAAPGARLPDVRDGDVARLGAGQQAGVDAVLRLSIGAVLLAFALWLWGRFVQGAAAGARRRAGCARGRHGVAAAWLAWPTRRRRAGGRTAAAAGGIATQTPRRARADGRHARRARRRAQLGALQRRAAGRAARAGSHRVRRLHRGWCISCQFNKKVVLEADAVRAGFGRVDAVLLRADWTHRDEAITRRWRASGRNGCRCTWCGARRRAARGAARAADRALVLRAGRGRLTAVPLHARGPGQRRTPQAPHARPVAPAARRPPLTPGRTLRGAHISPTRSPDVRHPRFPRSARPGCRDYLLRRVDRRWESSMVRRGVVQPAAGGRDRGAMLTAITEHGVGGRDRRLSPAAVARRARARDARGARGRGERPLRRLRDARCRRRATCGATAPLERPMPPRGALLELLRAETRRWGATPASWIGSPRCAASTATRRCGWATRRWRAALLVVEPNLQATAAADGDAQTRSLAGQYNGSASRAASR
jgi:hypothetical protein